LFTEEDEEEEDEGDRDDNGSVGLFDSLLDGVLTVISFNIFGEVPIARLSVVSFESGGTGGVLVEEWEEGGFFGVMGIEASNVVVAAEEVVTFEEEEDEDEDEDEEVDVDEEDEEAVDAAEDDDEDCCGGGGGGVSEELRDGDVEVVFERVVDDEDDKFVIDTG
jgi:hypothetical protein